MLEKLVCHLERKKFLLERLSLSPACLGKAKEMYMGVCKIDGEEAKGRRIDIKSYPKEQFGYAILYFTGSGEFNRCMRGWALEKGYTLSDHGM